MALGEATLPVIVVILISVIGWRVTYFGSSLFIMFFLLPLIILLLRKFETRFVEKISSVNLMQNVSNDEKSKSFTRLEVLKDFRFYLMAPGLMAPGIILTALFFHHLNIADSKNWSYLWITGNYFIYSFSISFIAIVVGGLIDKFTAKVLVIFSLVPLIFSMLCLSISFNPYIVICLLYTSPSPRD